MPIKHKIGYDVHILYSMAELAEMYRKDGMEPKEARIKAREIYRALNEMRSSERRFWQRVRDNELTDGLEPEPMEEIISAT